MEVGIAYDLKSDFLLPPGSPEDALEEYDSEATVHGIARALIANGFAPRPLGGRRSFIEKLLADPPDLVFNIAEGFGSRSREAHVPGVCEMLGVPFTHSDPLALAVSLDKAACKRLVSACGVSTPSFAVVERPSDIAGISLRFPAIAKPAFEGSSIGIRRSSRISDAAALEAKIGSLLRDYRQPILVEEFCPGPEFTVGILGNGEGVRVIGVMEISPRTGSFEEFVYSIEAKRNYLTEVEYKVPPDRPRDMLEKVEAAALRAYRALGCRDIARVDLRVGADGEPKFLEINPLPGLNPVTSDIVILASRCGLTYEALIGNIVAEARARYGI